MSRRNESWGLAILHLNFTALGLITNVMVIDVDVLSTTMNHWALVVLIHDELSIRMISPGPDSVAAIMISHNRR